MPDPVELVPGAVVGSKYVLERPLARGGMGSVWLGRHLSLDAPVALKFMHDAEGATPMARTRFEREAKAAALLRSPHIVQILDFGIDGGMPFLVMEYLAGEDLSARLEREGRLGLAAVTRSCARSRGASSSRTTPGSCIGISNPATSSSRARGRKTR